MDGGIAARHDIAVKVVSQHLHQRSHGLGTALAGCEKFDLLFLRAGAAGADVLRGQRSTDKDAGGVGRLMPCVLAGSAGLARALTRSQLLGSLTAAPALKLPQVSRLLVLSGSISAVSQEQCRVLLERTHCPVFKLKPAGALTDPRTEAQRLAARVTPNW